MVRLLLCLLASGLLCEAVAAAKPKPKAKKQGTEITLNVLPFPMAPSEGVFLDVRDAGNDVSSGHSANTTWTGDVVIKNSKKRDKSLEIVVRNSGGEAKSATLQWFFVSLGAADGEKQIFDRGTKDLELAPTSSQSNTVTSKELQSTQISRNGEAQAKGRKIYGWIVRLLDDDDKVIAQKCSDGMLEAVTRDAAKLQKLQSPRGLSN
ncbi:MAG: hypothetical protein QOD99_2819 [Chthoniobacter sp.]|jgi:hypothetical protein|nr:hypothetical protein [Chthoniobacter sp.]